MVNGLFLGPKKRVCSVQRRGFTGLGGFEPLDLAAKHCYPLRELLDRQGRQILSHLMRSRLAPRLIVENGHGPPPGRPKNGAALVVIGATAHYPCGSVGARMSPLPDTMLAIEIRAPGGPDVLTPVTRPVPKPADMEIVIKVAAAG